jgi:glycosyltransferase involved in cell wall biosynthesis
MKVVILNTRFQGGGAAIAARRLWEAHRQQGLEAELITLDGPLSEGSTPLETNWVDRKKGFARFALDRIWFFTRAASKELRFAWSSGRWGLDLASHPLVRKADLIHLHWVNDGFLSIEGLKALARLNKPIVWTFHDMWPFTGGCHYSGDCEGFMKNCGHCPMLKSPSTADVSAQQQKAKRMLFATGNWAGVGCSEWITREASKSSLWSNKTLQAIPNPIQTNFFKPGNKELLRKKYGVPNGQKVLLFTAMSLHDQRKGFDLLEKALHELARIKPEFQPLLLIAGKSSQELGSRLPFKAHLAGPLPADKMPEVYALADAMVLPSRQDNLPNTIMEAMSCGLPVAAFKIGGIPEMVIPGQTGELADPFDSLSLAHAIDQVLTHSHQYESSARQWVLDHYSYPKISDRYKAVYHQLLGKTV